METTCRTCKHWHVVKIPNARPVLGQPKPGQCRQGPPSVCVQSPQGIMVVYTPVSDDTPSCGQYSERPGNGDGKEIELGRMEA